MTMSRLLLASTLVALGAAASSAPCELDTTTMCIPGDDLNNNCDCYADFPPVLLGTSGNYAILAKAGISTVPTSKITGDIGVSPIAATAITGFSLTADSSGTFATSTQVWAGKAYASNYAAPIPAHLTTAVSDMETAYTDANGRTQSSGRTEGAFLNVGRFVAEPVPPATEGANVPGDLSGLTLVPGIYKWSTAIKIATSKVTLKGGADDKYIFLTSGDIEVDFDVELQGGLLAKNIVWVCAGKVKVAAGVKMNGVLLAKTDVDFKAGSSLDGRIDSR